jgi:hypothetical protein
MVKERKMNQPVRTTALAWTSFTFGLIGLLIYGLMLLVARIGSLGPIVSDLNIPNWLLIRVFGGLGGLALVIGIAAVVAIIRGRHGWAPAIVGIVLGLFDLVLGLAFLALSNLQLNIGPF